MEFMDGLAKLGALGGEGDGGSEALFPGHEPAGAANEVDFIGVSGDGPNDDDGSAVALTDDEFDG